MSDFVLSADGSNAVVCPKCGGCQTHQGKLFVFERCEDAEETLVVTVDDDVHIKVKQSKLAHNPSRRRNGVRIEMDCETCGSIPDLVVYQHKGGTYVEWGNEHGPNS